MKKSLLLIIAALCLGVKAEQMKNEPLKCFSFVLLLAGMLMKDFEG